MQESERIVKYISGQLPLTGYLSFSADTDNPAEKLSLVKDLMLTICEYEASSWPSDEQWDKLLPNWFLQKIKSRSPEEIDRKNTVLWDYGSWLDAMKYRGWEWFSSKVEKSGFSIILEPHTFPFSVNPLEYVIFETDVPLESIYFNEYSR